MCQMAVPKFVTFCAIVPPAPRGRLRPLSIQLSNWIWKFSLGKRHPQKYMSNRKEILFKGKEILLTDMTKFSLPVDVSALTHRPAVGRNTNTLKKKYCTRRRFKEQNFLQSGNSKEAYLIVSMHFYNSSYHFCKALKYSTTRSLLFQKERFYTTLH